MAMYFKAMHSLQVRMDAGLSPETGKTVIVSKTFDNINKSIVAADNAQTTQLYEFAELVVGVSGYERLQSVTLHQHGDLSI